MNKEFIDLTLLLEEELYKITEKEQKRIYKALKQDLNDLLSEISDVVIKNSIDDNLLSVKMLDKKALKKDFSKRIRELIKGQYSTEKTLTGEILENASKHKYNMDSYVFSLGIDVNYKLKKLSNYKLKQIIDHKIKSELWSDRIWKNKKVLEKDLKRDIYRILDGKTDVNKIEKTIRNKFNQDAHKTKRLLRTEVARVQNEVNEVWAKDHDMKQQLFMATLDNKTSTICRDYDGKVYEFDDSDKPIPPLHPNCRSLLVNVPFEGWKPTVRRDNITKENVNYSTYKEWIENQ